LLSMTISTRAAELLLPELLLPELLRHLVVAL
jgi:hypothetical protein